MFSYDQFKSQIAKEGLARQNRFEVLISPPNFYPAENEKISLYCQSVSIPGVNVASDAVRLMGEVVEIPYDRTFSGANMSFYVDSRMDVRKYFDDWINEIQNTVRRTFSYPDDFKSREIKVTVLKLDDTPVYSITMYDAFPKSLGQLSLSNDSTGVMTFDVSFDYRYYTTEQLADVRDAI